MATLNNLPETQPKTTQQHAPEPELRPIPKGQSFAHRTVLTVYRVFAIAALYAVLIGIVSYAFIMGFYAVNTTWAAPVILSDSDEKSLDFLEKLVTSRQTLEDLKVDVTRQQSSLAEMTEHRGDLIALDPALQHAIDREHAHDKVVGPELVTLDAQKLKDNATTQQVLQELEQTETQIRKDLAVGLITKADADTQLAALNQSRDAYTDSKIAEVLLTDTVLDKTTWGTKSLDVLEKQAELRSEIAQIDVAINIAAKQLEEDNRQVERLKSAIATAKQSPYYLNANGSKRLYFGFVPYDNQADAKVGTPIYDCYLNMILCRKVGSVKQIFLGEQTIMHPIFKTQVRGLMIQMDLSHPESAKSKTVFLGHKPLLF